MIDSSIQTQVYLGRFCVNRCISIFRCTRLALLILSFNYPSSILPMPTHRRVSLVYSSHMELQRYTSHVSTLSNENFSSLWPCFDLTLNFIHNQMPLVFDWNSGVETDLLYCFLSNLRCVGTCCMIFWWGIEAGMKFSSWRIIPCVISCQGIIWRAQGHACRNP